MEGGRPSEGSAGVGKGRQGSARFDRARQGCRGELGGVRQGALQTRQRGGLGSRPNSLRGCIGRFGGA